MALAQAQCGLPYRLLVKASVIFWLLSQLHLTLCRDSLWDEAVRSPDPSDLQHVKILQPDKGKAFKIRSSSTRGALD